MRTRSGQTTVATAGTAVQISSTVLKVSWIRIKALAANTDTMYVGQDGAGDVRSSNGYPILAGDDVEDRALKLDYRNPGTGKGSENLQNLWVDAAVNGEKIAWIAGLEKAG